MGDAAPSASADAVVVLRPSSAPSEEEALAILARGSKSFSFAGWFLPADQRADAALLYAFCRLVDDLADDSPDPAAADRALQALTEDVTSPEPRDPLVTRLREMFERRNIDPRHALDLIDGVRSDLGEVRVASDGDLVRYSYRVASTVGLMMCGVLGVTDREALPYAVDLGVAMQLTNICRDVREDAMSGRVYLPATRLTALGCPEDPAALLARPAAVQHVVLDLLSLADRYYRSAESGMAYIPWRPRWAILVAARVYREIGVLLAERGGHALAGRTVVPWPRRLWVALKAVLSFPWLPWRERGHRRALHRALQGFSGADAPDGVSCERAGVGSKAHAAIS